MNVLRNKALREKRLEEQIDVEFVDYGTDFVKEADEVLEKKYRMTRKERGFNVVFDVLPK